MSLTKVFNVCVDYSQIPPHLYGKRSREVEQDISQLAKKEKVSVTFHKFADEGIVGGAPAVLVEMPADFADKVKKITHVTGLNAPDLPTRPRTPKV